MLSRFYLIILECNGQVDRFPISISCISMLTRDKKSLCYSIAYCYDGAQWYEQFLQVGWLYRALILLGLALCLPSAPCLRFSWCCVDIKFFWLHPSLYLLVSWAWWDWPLTWLTNNRPSVLCHCWLGHLSHKIVFEMTYYVLSGMLNPTIPHCPARKQHEPSL